MTETEIRGNAMLAELTLQRDTAANRNAILSADLAVARARIQELEAELTSDETP
jgi:uncharacterized protein YigA (DUF484 family)